MTLTLATAKAIARHAMGGDPPDFYGLGSADASLARIVNDAGKAMFVSHPWNFRVRTSMRLSTVADQAHVDLPPEFGEMVAIEGTSAPTRIELTTISDILRLRNGTTTSSGSTYRAAIVHVPESGPRLAIWPTPSSSETDIFSIVWRASWKELAADEDAADVPPWAEPLLNRFVRAHAQGFKNDTIDDLLDRVRASAAFADAVRYDGSEQGEYGPVDGSAVSIGAVYAGPQVRIGTVSTPE